MSVQRQIRDVGVREFRKYGHLIGIYIPMKRDEENVRLAWDRFGDTIDRILKETGITEEEMADHFDVDRPRKRDEQKVREAVEQFGRTMQQIREETGMTEDEFADLFDLNKPFEE